MAPDKSWFVRLGDFFFKYRNTTTPIIVLTLAAAFPTSVGYFGVEWLEVPLSVVAVAISLAGLALRALVIGFAYIKRGGVNREVYADDLVTAGLFGTSRNPIYVGNFLIYFGLFLLHGNVAVIVLGMAIFTLMYTSVVAAEEYFLTEKFGNAYQDYCARVPRWIPRMSLFEEATREMRFSVKRVIVKDYSTIGAVIIALGLMALLRDWEAAPSGSLPVAFTGLVSLVVIVALAVLGVATGKRLKLISLTEV